MTLAKIFIEPNEQTLHQAIAAVSDREPSKITLEDLKLNRMLVSAFARAYFVLRQVRMALSNVPGVVLSDIPGSVARLAGVLMAVQSPQVTVNPAILDAIRGEDQWQKWAIRLLSEGDLVAWDGTREGLRNICEEVFTSSIDKTWSIWAHVRLGRVGAELGDDVGMRAEIGERLDECRDWRHWAQRALGLSDAYVQEQKLQVDDLRRMISERL
jgi:hypothetical protein